MPPIIRELEQPGVMPLLLVINKTKGRMLEKGVVPGEVGVTQGELNSAVEKLIKLGLMRRVRSKILPYTGDLELTEKGRSVASRLAEIQLFLAEKKRVAFGDDLGDLPVARDLAEEKSHETPSEKLDPVQGIVMET